MPSPFPASLSFSSSLSQSHHFLHSPSFLLTCTSPSNLILPYSHIDTKTSSLSLTPFNLTSCSHFTPCPFTLSSTSPHPPLTLSLTSSHPPFTLSSTSPHLHTDTPHIHTGIIAQGNLHISRGPSLKISARDPVQWHRTVHTHVGRPQWSGLGGHKQGNRLLPFHSHTYVRMYTIAHNLTPSGSTIHSLTHLSSRNTSPRLMQKKDLAL